MHKTMRHILNQILRPHPILESQPVIAADGDADEFADFPIETIAISSTS